MAELLAGKDVNLWINHTTVTSGIWKVAVCATEHNLSRQKTETTVITKCGSQTTAGTDDDSIGLTLVFITSEPAAGELTASDMEDIYALGDEFSWRICDAYPSASYIDKYGLGTLTAMEETYPAEGFVQFVFTLKVNGAITKLV